MLRLTLPSSEGEKGVDTSITGCDITEAPDDSVVESVMLG